MEKPLVSLCIPTNGIVEWVIPVLESIYSQNVDDNLFEVVITDNGQNSILEQRLIDFTKSHNNLRYFKTTDYQFLNQISCFKKAEGELIKFINHRMKLKNGGLEKLINICKQYRDEKPVVYFSNGNLKQQNIMECLDFNSFVKSLSIFSSWSGGLCVWNTDIEKMNLIENYNIWFPHTDLLFMNKENSKYIIFNEHILEEINIDDTKKGKYNLFYVFAVEYPLILTKLLQDKLIDKQTFLFIKKQLLNFIINLYAKYVVLRKTCSYEISDVSNSIRIFYSNTDLLKIKIKSRILVLLKRV